MNGREVRQDRSVPTQYLPELISFLLANIPPHQRSSDCDQRAEQPHKFEPTRQPMVQRATWYTGDAGGGHG